MIEEAIREGRFFYFGIVFAEFSPLMRVEDAKLVWEAIPYKIQDVMRVTGARCAGGFPRDVLRRERPKDLDLFFPDQEMLNKAVDMMDNFQFSYRSTKNAYTYDINVLGTNLPVQLVTKRMYADPTDLIESFDFSVCRAVVWVHEYKVCSLCDEDFYEDLEKRELRLLAPNNGSFRRMLRFHARGWKVPDSALKAFFEWGLKKVGAVIESGNVTRRFDDTFEYVSVDKVIGELIDEEEYDLA